MTKMKCQVTSDTTRKVMISREVKVPSYKEICGGEKIRVHLGYNNQQAMLVVENNKLLWGARRNGVSISSNKTRAYSKGDASFITENWEIFHKFFSVYNIEPIWLDCGYNWGRYDEEQGGWTGCMGKV